MPNKYPIYTAHGEMKGLKPGLYLGLFHGAKTLKARKALGDAGEWGQNGPCIGPLKFIHTTYSSTIKFEFENPDDAAQYGLDSNNLIMIPGKDHTNKQGFIEEGCIQFDGVNYGDWSVFIHKE
jgi:hypothetical protein